MRHLCEDCIARREAEAGAEARMAEFRRQMSRDNTLTLCGFIALVADAAVAVFVARRESDAYFAAKVAATRTMAAGTAPEMRAIVEAAR